MAPSDCHIVKPGSPLKQKVGPFLGQFPPARHVQRPVVGCLRHVRRGVGQHQVDNVPIGAVCLIHH